MSVLRTEHLSKWYGQVIGVNDITLEIEPGVTGLLGPNGAGKSTLLHLMTGHLKPSQGKVTLDQVSVWNHPDLYRDVGFCPDLDHFYESMTGLRFVQSLAQLSGYHAQTAYKLALEAIETVGLTDAKGRKIGGYSKGMRQRIKLAQALVHQPQTLFLDEPLTGMDPIGRRHIIALVRRLGVEGRTVLVSSHILHEIEMMTNHILLMNHGRILAEGNLHRIRELIDEHPHNVSIRTNKARFLASLLANYPDVISIRFVDNDETCVVETIQPDTFYPRLTDIVLEHEVEITDLHSPDDNLEAVFRYLVEK